MDNEWKEIWQQASEELPPTPPLSIDLTKEPLGMVQKIKRVIYWENRFNQLFTIVGVLWFVLDKEYLKGLGVGLLLIPFLLYYQRLLNKLNEVDVNRNVQDYLKESYQILRTFVNHYKIISLVLGSIGAVIGFGLGGHNDFLFINLIKIESILGIAISTIITVLACYGVVQLMYGKKVGKLKEMIDSFEG